MFFKKSVNSNIRTGLENLSELPELYGTYKGFSPTVGSACCQGELEVIINATGIKISHATGLEINTDRKSLYAFQRLTQEKTANLFEPGAFDPEQNNVYAFQAGENGSIFLFMPVFDNSNTLDLIIRNGISSLLGPTMAFGPENIRNGRGQKTLEELEREGMPLLKHGGKVPSQDGVSCCNIM